MYKSLKTLPKALFLRTTVPYSFLDEAPPVALQKRHLCPPHCSQKDRLKVHLPSSFHMGTCAHNFFGGVKPLPAGPPFSLASHCMACSPQWARSFIPWPHMLVQLTWSPPFLACLEHFVVLFKPHLLWQILILLPFSLSPGLPLFPGHLSLCAAIRMRVMQRWKTQAGRGPSSYLILEGRQTNTGEVSWVYSPLSGFASLISLSKYDDFYTWPLEPFSGFPPFSSCLGHTLSRWHNTSFRSLL